MSNKELKPFVFELDVKHIVTAFVVAQVKATSETEAKRKIRKCIKKTYFENTEEVEFIEDILIPEGYVPRFRITKKLYRRKDYEQ